MYETKQPVEKQTTTGIRKMTLADIPAVCEVNRASFSDPWTEDIFMQEITLNQYAYYFVLEVDQRVVGYIGAWFVFDDAQITTFAVHPDYRGHSYGKQLFYFVIEQAIAYKIQSLTLEVRISNIQAQHLYRQFGLTPIDIRKKYYKDNGEDAIVMGVNFS